MYPFKLPEFYMPFPARVHPDLEATRVHAKEWVCDMGMLTSEPGLVGIWDEETFDAFEIALFAALTHPDATNSELQMISLWDVWAFAFDDYFMTVYRHRRDVLGARIFIQRLAEFMPQNGIVTLTPSNPVERGLADAWSRTMPTMAAELRRQFPGYVMEFTGSALWELANVTQNRIPDPVDYIEMRRKTAGTQLSTGLAKYLVKQKFPNELFRTQPMRTLADSFADNVDLRNDIFSYRKEVDTENDVNNGVLVIQHFFDCSLQQAVNLTNDLMTARLRQFEETVAIELPALFEESNIDQDDQGGILNYVKGLQDWLAGDLQWYWMTRRYTDAKALPSAPASAVPPPSSPIRIGMSATQVSLLFGSATTGAPGTPRI